MTVSGLPDTPADGQIPFGIYGSAEDDNFRFEPVYYPTNLRVTADKEMTRTNGGCDGEQVSIKKLKNSNIHISGKIHESDLPDLHELAHKTEKVEVISPSIQRGGMECIVKKTEQGDMISWDGFPEAQEWMFEYTIDLVSTGKDEYDQSEGGRFERKNTRSLP
jgi:hypothetical protein